MPHIKKLTQSNILNALARGMTYAEIATQFEVSTNALYLHMRRIRQKGIEPTDINAVRQHILGPNAKHIEIPTSLPSPKQLQLLQLVNAGHTMAEIQGIMGVGAQTTKNTACEAFKRIGIDRKRMARKAWRAKLRGYLTSPEPISGVPTMDDPFFN